MKTMTTAYRIHSADESLETLLDPSRMSGSSRAPRTAARKDIEMMTKYGEIAQSWPRIAAAVNEACRVPKAGRQLGHTRPDLTRAEAQRRAVELANRPDAARMGAWTVGQLRQALVAAESDVAS